MPARIRHLVLPALALAAALPAASGAEGTVTTFAGTVPGFAGDGGPASAARMTNPGGAAVAPDGSVVIADTGNDAVRRVAPSGIITTIAGANGAGFSGDGGPATGAELDSPSDVAVLADGTVLVADTGNDRVRAISPAGTISTVAGSARGLAGDGGPAVFARLDQPRGVTALAGGGYLIADSGNARIRAVSASGVITTAAGTVPGFAGDGGPATAARLSDPRAATPVPGGGLLIADLGNARVRRVAADGTISTVAGGGTGGALDGGVSALRTRLGGPGDAVPLTNGGFLVSDTLADRLTRVTPLGTVVPVAGERRALGGDGGPGSAASLDTPTTVTPAGGAFLIADSGNSRIRRLSALGALPPPDPLSTVGVSPFGGSVTVRPRATATAIGLHEPDLAPNGSAVDATGGVIDLTVRAPDSGAEATARASGGRFLVTQAVADRAVADLRLTGPLACSATAAPASRHSEDARRKKRKKPSRHVRVKVRGRYSTTGRYAVAVANGTAWTMTDRCDRTTVRVTEGTVTVRDLRTGRTVKVRAGRTYTVLARATLARH